MKVYRIKHKPSGEYVCNSYNDFTNKKGQVYFRKCFNFYKYALDPDYEILYDEIKD